MPADDSFLLVILIFGLIVLNLFIVILVRFIRKITK
jgi:hypothetical protein